MKSRLALATLTIAAVCALCPAAPTQPTPPDDTAATYKRLTDSAGPALVTVKFVKKMEGASGEGLDSEINGVMIEPSGLILVANWWMGGFEARRGRAVSPTDIKILIGDDSEGLKAKILARDRELDLCWIQIDDDKAKGKTFRAVEFSTAPAPAVGEKIYTVQRLGKFFDHALSVEEDRVGGVTRKPRTLLIPSGSSGSIGQMLLNADGKAVGFNIVQAPDKEDIEGGESIGPGNAAVLLLPAAEVLKATARGKEMAAKSPPAPAKEDSPPDKKDDKPAPEKKDAPKAP